MGRTSKWVEVESGSQPAAKVARRALADRLQLAWRYLKRSAEGAPSDIENVHQLRVSTRRAMAVLSTFEEWLPRRKCRWMRRQLKNIRKTAGAARDLDVMLARFAPLAQAEDPAGPYHALVHRLRARRKRAQDPIDALYEKLRRKHFPRRMAKLCRRLKPRGSLRESDTSFSHVADRTLIPLVREYFASAANDPHEIDQLHALRILGKQLRYAVEIFAGAFPPALRLELYPQIAEIQDRLGAINDHATARARFSEWQQEESTDGDLHGALAELIAEEAELQEQSRTAFLRWFTADRRAALERQFAQVLGIDTARHEPAFTLRQAE
jgi:CHAD domain-containing protein